MLDYFCTRCKCLREKYHHCEWEQAKEEIEILVRWVKHHQASVEHALARNAKLEATLIKIRDDRSPQWDPMDYKQVAKEALQ